MAFGKVKRDDLRLRLRAHPSSSGINSLQVYIPSVLHLCPASHMRAFSKGHVDGFTALCLYPSG